MTPLSSTDFDWESLLRDLNLKLLDVYAEEDYADQYGWEIPPDKIASQWLGNPPATEEQIVAAETRLGIQLPLSYRQFLKISNGWDHTGWSELKLWSIEEVDWMIHRYPHMVESYNQDDELSVSDEEYFVYGEDQDPVHMRDEYLLTALEISSDSGDGDNFLLIPEVITAEGEWEAWHLGSKLPGAYRYRSFYELMQKVLEEGEFIL